MNTQYTEKLKTNELGDIDVNYYIAKGRQLRAEAVGEMLKRLFAKLRPRRTNSHQLPLNVNFRH